MEDTIGGFDFLSERFEIKCPCGKVFNFDKVGIEYQSGLFKDTYRLELECPYCKRIEKQSW